MTTDPAGHRKATMTTDSKAIATLMQNPTMLILLLMVLGGQGADLFASNSYTLEIRELRADVQQALAEITDHSERIGRLERRLDVVTEAREQTAADLEEARRRINELERALEDVIEE